MPKKNKPEKERTFWYTIARGIAFLCAKIFFPVKLEDRENRLRTLDGPCILLCNHWSLFDPLSMGYFCKNTELRFLGKKEIGEVPVLGRIITKGVHMIAVDRHHTDLKAMRTCAKTLKEGKVLVVFPEGTRHHTELMEPMETGASLIALRTDAPVLPVYIHNKLRLFRRTRITVMAPMEIDDLRQQGADMQTAEALSERIRGVYLAEWEKAQVIPEKTGENA